MSAEAVTETLPEESGHPAEPSAGRRTGERLWSWAAWSLTAVWTAWAVARTLGLDGLPPLDRIAVPLISLTPYMTAGALIPVLVAVLVRRRRAAVVAAVAALALVAALLPRATADAATTANGPELRILSANVFFGRASMAELVRLVETRQVDVLSLQEFTPDARSGLEEGGLRAQLPYEVVDPRWGAGGSALYSRYPLTVLPALPGTTMAHPRAALRIDGRQIEVTAVHPLPPLGQDGLADWKHSLATLPPASSGSFQILAGDFNATLDHARFRDLLERGYTDAADRRGQGLTSTWGFTDFPRLTIDHILVPREVAVSSYDVLSLSGSDHHPILAGLRLP